MRVAGDWRRWIPAALCAVLVVTAPFPAHGCATCFGDPGDAATQGMNHAIWLLLGTIGLVQVGVVRLFVGFHRRSKAAEKEERPRPEGGLG